MDPHVIGVAGIVLMLAMIFVGVPVGFALILVGIIGNIFLAGVPQAAQQLTAVIWENGANFLLIALPLFVLMGQLVYHSRIATDLYDAIYKWLGRLPGGLAVSSTVAAAGFGAVTGSSLAAVHTMGTMVMPEVRRYKYDLRLASGSIAAAGTLAILIPPSIILVVYGIFTETSIGDLFMAGIIPGVVLTLGFCGYIVIRCIITPAMGPMSPVFPWRERLRVIAKLFPTIAIFLIVIGGIYTGIFTPSEAAGIGAAGVVVVAMAMGRLTRKVLLDSLMETALVSGTLFTIFVGGVMMSRFLVQTEITPLLIAYIGDMEVNRYLVMVALIAMYLVLGAVLDTFAMLILTLPFVFPIVMALNFDAVWFGIFVTIMTELALVTPPVGLNVYIMQTVAPECTLTDIFRGVMPFVIVTLGVIGLLIAFPEIATWLPYALRN